MHYKPQINIKCQSAKYEFGCFFYGTTIICKCSFGMVFKLTLVSIKTSVSKSSGATFKLSIRGLFEVAR